MHAFRLHLYLLYISSSAVLILEISRQAISCWARTALFTLPVCSSRLLHHSFLKLVSFHSRATSIFTTFSAFLLFPLFYYSSFFPSFPSCPVRFHPHIVFPDISIHFLSIVLITDSKKQNLIIFTEIILGFSI